MKFADRLFNHFKVMNIKRQRPSQPSPQGTRTN